MKKLIISISIVFALISCADKNAFKINGIVTNESVKDGTTIYLLKDYTGKIALDSTIVVDRKFEFKGTQEMPIVREIGIYRNTDSVFTFSIVIEPHNINVEVGEKNIVSGTLLNDRLQKQWSVMTEFYNTLNDIPKKYEAAESDSEKEELANYLNFAAKEYDNQIRLFIE